MVQSSTLALIAFLVAPAIAFPLTVGQEESFPRSFDDEVDERSPEPKINWGQTFRTGLNVAGKAASILLRDEEGNVYVREVDIDDLSERDLVALGMDELEAREPKFKLGSAFKKIGRFAGKAAKVAGTVAQYVPRDLDDDQLDARDYVDELDEREPKFKLGSAFKKIGRFAGKAAKVAGTVAQYAARDLDDDQLDARDYIDELDEREFVDIDDLDARDELDADEVLERDYEEEMESRMIDDLD